MTSTYYSALGFVRGDSLSRRREVNFIWEALTRPASQISDLEAWCRERDMLIEVCDDDYREPRLSVIG